MAESHCEFTGEKAWLGLGTRCWDPRAGGTAIVPLAFFVENYRTIVNLSHILSRACLGGESGERGNFPGQDTGQ